jgi:putative glutamine amidotransferase
MSRPLVVIPACTKVINDLTFDAVARVYTSAVAELAHCQPVIVPLDTSLADISAVLAIADGILLTGSVSNVAPDIYGDEPPISPDHLDPARDAVTLPLVKTAIERKLPLFAICRGFQEVNVALGGTLHQAVHTAGPYNDHRAEYGKPADVRFRAKHTLKLKDDLRDWIGQDEILVNSLHGQGINKLAQGLRPQAHAEDGLVEAVLGPDGHPFFLGVQWHPEWGAKSNPISVKLFERFGAAVKSKAS